MALTQSERQKRYRGRLKEKEATKSLVVDDVFTTPFFLADLAAIYDFEDCLRAIGIDPPQFSDDRGPLAFSLANQGELRDMPYDFGNAQNSLGRAELMIAGLTDAARYLAEAVNTYKQGQIAGRMQDVEDSDLSAPEAKKAALKEAARLNKMLDQLDKQVRITFPQWKVTG